MLIERRIEIGGVEVRPGATWLMPLQVLQFQGRIRCVSASPESYVAELLFDNEVLITTEEHPTHDKVQKTLRQVVATRLRALLAE